MIFKLKFKTTFKYVIVLYFSVFMKGLSGQEIGYVSGINKIGINPNSIQPLYGFSIGTKLSKYFAFETNLFYSQRTIEDVTQADYLTFMAIPKLGFFTQNYGIYYAPTLSFNPTLYHSNIKNHTYLSTNQMVGGQIKLGGKIIADIKMGYHYGLTGAYFDNGSYKIYNGFEVLLGLKCLFNDK